MSADETKVARGEKCANCSHLFGQHDQSPEAKAAGQVCLNGFGTWMRCSCKMFRPPVADETKVGRVSGGTSLHAVERPELCPDGAHASWRTVRCDDDTDTIECSRCGRQREAACDFNEEFS